jgi:hypothetical protein
MSKIIVGIIHIIMRSLHDVHEMNAGHVHLSIRMIELENRWTDLDGIWCGRCAIRGTNLKSYFSVFYKR